jgi:glycosyltransferase involved in cell wall biosynthesis
VEVDGDRRSQAGVTVSVSVLILTLNEETNLRDCIGSLAWSDDVVVLDSYSTDQTCAIATGAGARVIQRKFDNWSAHQNWAVANIQFKHPWVLYLDADERCTVELRDEVLATARGHSTHAAYRIRRKDYFMGRWLKHAQLYPTWLVRLFRPAQIRYERLVNPVAVVDGSIGELAAHIDHYPFSHGVAHWIARHNKYSDMEAIEAVQARERIAFKVADVMSSDPNVRRRALKEIFFRMPARPAVKFCYYYLWRRGFLDGRPGLTYATLQAFYEYMIECKRRELLRRAEGLPV